MPADIFAFADAVFMRVSFAMPPAEGYATLRRRRAHMPAAHDSRHGAARYARPF